MPLPDNFYMFHNNRIVHANVTIRDLGDQDSMIRSLSSRAPIPVPEIVIPQLQKYYTNEIEVGVIENYTTAKNTRKVTILDSKRTPSYAISEKQFIACLPVNMLPIVSTFMPHNFSDANGGNTAWRGLRQYGGRGHTLAVEDVLHAILPDNTWLIFVLQNMSPEWALADILLEVHDKKGKTVRTPRMINIFDNGRVCVGTLNRFRSKDRVTTLVHIFEEFLASFWNDHLSNTPQHYWLRWDLDGNYVKPFTEISAWSTVTGSTYSPLVP